MINNTETAIDFFEERVGSNAALGYKPIPIGEFPEIMVAYVDQHIPKWTQTKPTLEQECILLCGAFINGYFEYDSFIIRKIEAEESWYWGVLCSDGDEWGDIEDLSSELYLVLPLPEPPQIFEQKEEGLKSTL